MTTNADIVRSVVRAPWQRGDPLAVMGHVSRDVRWTVNAADPTPHPGSASTRASGACRTSWTTSPRSTSPRSTDKALLADGDLVVTWIHVAFTSPNGRAVDIGRGPDLAPGRRQDRLGRHPARHRCRGRRLRVTGPPPDRTRPRLPDPAGRRRAGRPDPGRRLSRAPPSTPPCTTPRAPSPGSPTTTCARSPSTGSRSCVTTTAWPCPSWPRPSPACTSTPRWPSARRAGGPTGPSVSGAKVVYCHTPARWLYQTRPVPGRLVVGCVGRRAGRPRPGAAAVGPPGRGHGRPVPGQLPGRAGPGGRRLRHRRRRGPSAGRHRRRRPRDGRRPASSPDSCCACRGSSPTRTWARWSRPSPAGPTGAWWSWAPVPWPSELTAVGAGQRDRCSGRVDDDELRWLYGSCLRPGRRLLRGLRADPGRGRRLRRTHRRPALGRLPRHDRRGDDRGASSTSRLRSRSPPPSTSWTAAPGRAAALTGHAEQFRARAVPVTDRRRSSTRSRRDR